MNVSKNKGTPKTMDFVFGVSIIFTIHFGGKIPLFLETPIHIYIYLPRTQMGPLVLIGKNRPCFGGVGLQK